MIDFYGTKLDGSVVERHYQNTQGMEAVFNMNTSNPLVQPVYIYKVSQPLPHVNHFWSLIENYWK